jgi:hypothetical protein
VWEPQGGALEAVLGGFYGGEAGEELIDAGGCEEGPDAVGDADEGDLCPFVGLRDIEVDEDAEAGGVHVLERGAVEDEEVGFEGLQLGLESEDVAQGKGSLQGEDGAARIRRGAEGVVEVVLGHPLSIGNLERAQVNIL